ncbi:unnamed protein product [Effrenium voratum]|uniref:Uncharacterized protein n=1 Tax=Effrenium voratum TaxID=2562239 RepID=A0AA36MKR6_9DINO|nr:unnamed protein product [Effrenium voratum]CAJ1456514.1 unnamed protein product [Effrenium voratum]
MVKEKKPKKLLERVTLLGSGTELRLEVPVGTSVSAARDAVQQSWGWPGARLLFFGSDAALLWDEGLALGQGSVVVGRAPWPVTAVLRPAASQPVNHKVPVLIPAGSLATACTARRSVARVAGLAPELLEQSRPVQAGETERLEDDANLEELGLKVMICNLRPAAHRMLQELRRIRVLWTCGKQGKRPPPEEVWRLPITDAPEGAEAAVAACRDVMAGVVAEAKDLAFHPEDAYRWRVQLKRPVPSTEAPLEVMVTFPADYPVAPPELEGCEARLSALENWTPANTIFCVLGELADYLMLHKPEAKPSPPFIPPLPL